MKNAIDVPEDLTSVAEVDELKKLAADVREAAEALAADSKASDGDAVDAIEALAAEFDRINEEVASREAAEKAKADRQAAALAKFQGGDDDAAEEEVVVDEAEEEPVAAAADEEVVVEAAAEDNSEAAVVEADTAEADSAEASIEDDSLVEASADTVNNSEVAVSDTNVQSSATASLDAGRSDALAPRSEEVAPAAGFTASNAVGTIKEGAALSASDIAKAITNKRHGFGRTSAGTHERIVLASAQSDLPYAVGGSEVDNFEVLEQVRKDWAASRSQETALVAAGGVCAPLAPSYEFFRLAEPMNPVEQALPVAEAPRGGIRFITPPDFRDAAGGVRVTTEAEDAAGYPPTEPKPCVRVVCPPVEECRVDAVSQCVTFGNLNYRVFPEQVEAFLADLAVIFTQTKEVFYLDAIDEASTSVTFSPDYSATRGVTYTLLAAAANYRRRHHMPADATLTLFLPSWVVEFIKVDLINDHSMGLGFLGAGEAEVNQVFASMNLDVNWYYDSATGAGQAFADLQDEGELNLFPSTVVAYLFAPGTFVRLNAGTLDLGVVRDSVLNGTNDLQIFSEEWIQVCQVGLESLRLEIALCPDGTAPEPVAPLECVGGSV